MAINKRSKAAIGAGAGVTAVALTYYFWCNRHNLKGRFKEWKNERIRNAYYDPIEQKDIAWG